MGQFEDMQVFVRVVEAGGIGLAAEQLGIAKSAVSRRLAELEARLGVTLINRTTRTSSITETGNLYYTRALGIIDDVSELNALASDPEISLQGTLRLAAPLTFGLTHLSPALDEFTKQHPELTLHVDFSDRHIDLVEGGFDLAFRISDLNDSSLKARRIFPTRMVLCASPAYLDKWGAPENPSDLKHHHLLRYTFDDTTTWKLIDKQGNETLVPIQAKMLANNGDFLCGMAISGHGILNSPTFITWEAVSKGELVPVLTEYTLPSSNAYAVYPKTRYLSQRVRLLIDFLVERFGDNPYWDQSTSLASD